MKLSFRTFLESLESFFIGVKSKEEMIKAMRSFTRTQRDEAQRQTEEINRKNFEAKLGTTNIKVLYHGTCQHTDITQFELRKGKRTSGFMGAEYEVDNQGVFFSDSKELANSFGCNRSSYDRGQVYEAYVSMDKILDMSNVSKIPLNLRKLGLAIYNDEYSDNKTKLANKDIWWLLDRKPFVDEIKKSGYDGVKFLEDKGTLRELGAKGGYTYLIFNMNKIAIKNTRNYLIYDLDSLWNYISTKLQIH